MQLKSSPVLNSLARKIDAPIFREDLRFISIGPSCIAATIFKDNNCRRMSYGFDWARSGSHHLRDFFILDEEAFYWRHIYSPSLILLQSGIPDQTNYSTASLVQKLPLYGFPYYYNPHRNYADFNTHLYLRRSFDRLRRALFDNSCHNLIMLADYTNKEHYTFFNKPSQALNYVHSLLSCFLVNYTLVLTRFVLADDPVSQLGYPIIELFSSANAHIAKFSFNRILDDESMRSHIHRLFLSQLLSQLHL